MTFTELLALDASTSSNSPATRVKPTPTSSKSKPVPRDTTTPRHQDTTVSVHHDTKPPAAHGTTLSRSRDIVAPSLVRRLRKRVRRLGKEAATYRFTRQEKTHLADLIYAYGRRGYRTSENEVVRIGVNWLLADYERRGEESVLHRMLKALHD
jgi:hypothetical protein